MSLLNYNKRVAIVTGSGQGMGREHALSLAKRGARVVVNDIAAPAADAVVAEITAAGGEAVASHDNIVTHAPAIVQTAIEEFGQLDIVVNNAAILRVALFGEEDPEEWWTIFNTALRGTVEVTRAAWPHLLKSDSARLINVASSAMLADPGLSAYGAAKGAIWALGNTLAQEADRVGIQVTTIMPTAWTPMTEDAYDDETIRSTLRDGLKAGHVAAFVTYLAHQDTTVHGDTFQVSGGRAGRMTLAALPAVRPAESTPERWVEQADALRADSDDLTQYRTTGELFGDEMIAANPAVADAFKKKDPAQLDV